MHEYLNVDVHRRLVIWGGADRGKELYQDLCSNAFNITIVGFADNRYEELNKEGDQQILSLPDVLRLFKKNEIDGVVIGARKSFVKEIEKELNYFHIPVFALPCWPLIGPEKYAKEYHSQMLYGEKLEIYRLKDVFLRIDFMRNIGWEYFSTGEVLSNCLNGMDVDQPFFSCNAMQEFNEDVCILASIFTNYNYAHILFDVLDKIIVAEKLGFQGKYVLFRSEILEEYTKLIPLEDDRIIWLMQEDNGKVFLFRNIISMEPYIHHCMPGRKLWHPGMKALLDFSKRIQDSLPENNGSYPLRIFVKRTIRRRAIFDENILSDYGFETIVPETMSIIEQIKAFYYADVIISPHGANSYNMIFMRSRTWFIELFGAGYVFPSLLWAVEEKKVRYQMVVSYFYNIESEIYAKRNEQYEDYYITEEQLRVAIRNAIES